MRGCLRVASGPYDGLHSPMRQRDPVPGADLLGDAAQAHTARPQLEDGDNGVHQGVADYFDATADLQLLEVAEAIGRAPARASSCNAATCSLNTGIKAIVWSRAIFCRIYRGPLLTGQWL
jgi:hypothetical protein